ncbi:hypothetical protein BIY26_21830 [Brenneria goodwinii]|uniref:Uncharacterized protein n=1 Tax=Brenneria goodwinii TaxID=1109412 RepID=A0AAE8JLC9_9GAMM|nr:hypothetical protein AWC36_18650 [Brenneria goodwinii]RLM16935.1 hypothetical protein BIY26_21830 [Brenneria goodwinii]
MAIASKGVSGKTLAKSSVMAANKWAHPASNSNKLKRSPFVSKFGAVVDFFIYLIKGRISHVILMGDFYHNMKYILMRIWLRAESGAQDQATVYGYGVSKSYRWRPTNH